MTPLRRALRAFGDFWWDFLIGDAPEFVLATGVVIALAYLLDDHRVVAAIVLPLVTAAFLVASTYRGRRRAADPPASKEAPATSAPPTSP